MALSVSLPISVTVTQSSALDIATGSTPLAFLANYVFASGTSAYQGTTFTSDNRTLGAGAADSFDLAGGLVDIFGNVVTFTRIRAILIETTAGSAGDLTLFAATAGSNAFVGPMNFGAQIRVPPGCTWGGAAPNPDGWPVIAGTADILFVSNQSAGNINYSIILIGTT